MVDKNKLMRVEQNATLKRTSAIDVALIANNKSRNRDRSFDLLKLYAMLSVVLDHTLQHWIGGGNSQNTQLYNWIFLSQMPIFMFVSGYFIIKGNNQTVTIRKLKDKMVKLSCSLLIPFVSYGIITSLLIGKCIFIKMFLYPDYSLWFLWALYWMQLFMILSQFICTHLFKKSLPRFIMSIIGYILCLAIVGIVYIKFPGKFDSKLIIYYSLFFLFGYLYSYCEKRLSFMLNKTFRTLCIPVALFVVAVIMMHHPSIINESETILNLVARVIGSVTSIVLVMNVCHFASKAKVVEKIARFGTLSLEMYYVHLVLLKMPLIRNGVSNAVLFLVKYCALVVLTFGVILQIKSNCIADLIFFGKIPKEKGKEWLRNNESNE